MLAALTGLCASLPEILSLLKNAWAYLQKVSGGDLPGFIAKSNEAFTLLNKAKTEAEMIEAAKALQAAIRGTT